VTDPQLEGTDVGLDVPWEAPDGTRWFYYPPTAEWNGWVPGEGGTWTWEVSRFRRLYPEAPRWDGWDGVHVA
jgi:hypothetical protein